MGRTWRKTSSRAGKNERLKTGGGKREAALEPAQSCPPGSSGGEEKMQGTKARDSQKPSLASRTLRDAEVDSVGARGPRPASPQTHAAYEVFDKLIPWSAHSTGVNTPAQSIDSLVGHLFQHTVEEGAAYDDTLKRSLASEELMMRNILENEASTKLATMFAAFYRESPSSSVCESRNSHSASSRFARSVGTSAGAQELRTTEAPVERANSALQVVLPCGSQREQWTKTPSASTAALSASDPLNAAHVNSRLGGSHGKVEEECDKVQRRITTTTHVLPSYGTLQGLQAGTAGSLSPFDPQAGLGLSSLCTGVIGGEGGSTAWFLYENEIPVFRPVCATATDLAVDVECETEALLKTGVNPQVCFRAIMRQVLFYILAMGLFFPPMAHSGLFAGVDIFNTVESSVPRRNVMKFTFLFADAAAFCVTTSLTAFFCNGSRFLRHGLLLAATAATVGGGFCLLHGYLSGSLVVLLLSQLLHAVGLAATPVAVLCINCAELGAPLGTVSLIFFTVHFWLVSGAAGRLIFFAVARLSSGGVAGALRVFLYLTYTGPVFALAFFMLLPPAECHGARRTLDVVTDARKLLFILRHIEVRFVFCCISGGCLLALVLLLTEAESLFSSVLFGDATSSVFADLYSLTVLVMLPLFLLPVLGFFVRFCGFGLLTTVVAAWLVGLISITTPSAAVATPEPTSMQSMIAVTSVLCGASLAVALAGPMRSLASVEAASLSVVVPALLFATLLSLCVALAAGVTAVFFATCLQTNHTGGSTDAGGMLARQARCVDYVALAMCLSALCLQITTAVKTFRVRQFSAAAHEAAAEGGLVADGGCGV
ncbi:hypothetical protein TraAM80_07088 [Trypanosoma rangeli]|uniref:Transmembrane protein n=1 Tax=Trypanosoma rangeli TaxID=5698 RepID=A0A422N730_TRYRA|nr:uncharacterized protein TraAM80_07088 [Trypanosoma rangeli]RNF01287.1 hypothetical protein TraAM80_07088 [Trypanosoma rangeli]|eukprot:RNF01287.1 hypothetical protein TraAM80_07088 [Trypanosoma rangeli]